jgi:hypothetical protein
MNIAYSKYIERSNGCTLSSVIIQTIDSYACLEGLLHRSCHLHCLGDLALMPLLTNVLTMRLRGWKLRVNLIIIWGWNRLAPVRGPHVQTTLNFPPALLSRHFAASGNHGAHNEDD